MEEALLGAGFTVFDGVGDAAAELFEVRFGNGELLFHIEKRGQFLDHLVRLGVVGHRDEDTARRRRCRKCGGQLIRP